MSLRPDVTALRKDRLDATALLLLLACCALWGGSQVLIKATTAQVPPTLQAAIRFGGASVLLLIWAQYKGTPVFTRDGLTRAGLLAGALFALEFIAMSVAISHTTASRLTVFVYTSPFWVAVLVPLFVKSEKLARWQWLGLSLAFLAVALALSDNLRRTGLDGFSWLGDGLALVAGMLWGLTTVVIRTMGLIQMNPVRLLFLQTAVTAVALPFASLALGEVWAWPTENWAYASLAFQTVVIATLSYLAWMWLLVHYPATQISAFSFLTPVFGVIFGAAWLSERITPTLWAGLALVCVGLVLVQRSSPGVAKKHEK
jgi:drug/metabolite transporter (DMT)-like permease